MGSGDFILLLILSEITFQLSYLLQDYCTNYNTLIWVFLEQKISARFVCSGKQLLYPTHNGADICDGKLQIIVRNKNKDKDFPGASGKISYSNTQCSHSDSDVEVGQISKSIKHCVTLKIYMSSNFKMKTMKQCLGC